MIKKLTLINQAFTKSSVRILKDVILDKLVEIWNKQKWKGGQSGTNLRQMIGVVASAGERRKT